VKFVNCKFENYKAWNSEFVDVVFDNCEFISTNFLGSTVMNVKIEHCKGVGAEFDDLRGNELLVEDTILNDRSSFTDGRIPFVFRNTTLSGVNMMGLSGNNTLLIEGGLLDEVNFGHSHFSTVTLRRVKQGEGGVKFNDITAESVTFENVDMTHGTAIARSRVKSVIVNGGNFGTTFDDSIIGAIYVRDAELYYMEFSEVNLPKVTISNCKLYDTGLYDGVIEEFSAHNSEFNIIVGENFKADTVVWDNVTLDGKIDLTNAHVEDFQVTRLKRGPKLQLITTGSNLKF
jgi:uncharacterized protein YjbI with pentapeptide repeats